MRNATLESELCRDIPTLAHNSAPYPHPQHNHPNSTHTAIEQDSQSQHKPTSLGTRTGPLRLQQAQLAWATLFQRRSHDHAGNSAIQRMQDFRPVLARRHSPVIVGPPDANFIHSPPNERISTTSLTPSQEPRSVLAAQITQERRLRIAQAEWNKILSTSGARHCTLYTPPRTWQHCSRQSSCPPQAEGEGATAPQYASLGCRLSLHRPTQTKDTTLLK